MGILATGAISALNQLLRREAWAREKLAPFASEVVELHNPPMPTLRIALSEDGYALAADDASVATLVITAKPGLLAALAQGEDQLMRAVDISGNAALATEILTLLRYLRWDVEEDLSRVFGDVLAHRLAGGARDFVTWQADAGRRLAENLLEYAVEERRIIVARAEFEFFAASVSRLRDDLARLEQRTEMLADRSTNLGTNFGTNPG